MPALDFILPTANTVSTGDGMRAASPARDESAGEPFDQVMTRVLSPSGADESTGPDRPGAVPATLGKGKQNTISTPPQRRRVQTRNAASEKAAPAAGETGDPSLQPRDNKSNAKTSESDAGKCGGDVTAGSPARNDTQVASGSLPGVIVQLVTALPTGVLPLFSPAAEKKNTSDTEAIGALVAQTGAKAFSLPTGTTSNPEVSPDKPGAELISSLKPDGRQKNTVKADEIATGKTKPGDSQPVLLPVNDPQTTEFSATDLPALEPACEPVVHLTQNEASPSTDLSAEAITTAQPESRGISAAKLYMPMKKTEKMNKVAGLAEKVLPGDADLSVPENNLPTADPPARVSPRNGPAMVVIGPSSNGSEPAAASAADGISTSSVVDLHSRSLERAHDMIALQAIRLVDSKSDSLRVVIKPGAGLQLSLEMRQHGEAIDIQVVLQRGDFSHLSQHWPELQQRLEQRGIRLAPLAGGENSTTNNGTDGFQQPQREFTNPDPLSASAFAEFALAGSPIQSTTPTPAVAPARRGWETWA